MKFVHNQHLVMKYRALLLHVCVQIVKRFWQSYLNDEKRYIRYMFWMCISC